MSQVWREDVMIPVTVLKVSANDKDLLQSLEVGTEVRLTGTSKGKGFQGVVKRYGFAGGPKSHGQKHSLRAPGSIGATGPQRTNPGQRMPGRMGGDRITKKRVPIIDVDSAAQTIMVKGGVPGMRGSTILIVLPEKEETHNTT